MCDTVVIVVIQIDSLSLLGSLMVAAWVLFTSMGITLARFYKDMWPKQQICGKAVWFVVIFTSLIHLI